MVSGFGDEWKQFDRVDVPDYDQIVEDYFRIFPWETISPNSVGFDLGCGTGRWAKYVSTKVGVLHCIDASAEAVTVARTNLSNHRSVIVHHASVDAIPLPDASADFGYSLGVLHHVPDTSEGLKACVKKLKKGSPFLLYLYYAFDNKPTWFRWLWLLSELLRKIISRLPYPLRFMISQFIAFVVYWPIARFAVVLEKLGMSVTSVPLSYYRDKSTYIMRTDALDRFGTRLEQRFTKAEIESMMLNAGLERIVFSEDQPFWVALGYKA